MAIWFGDVVAKGDGAKRERILDGRKKEEKINYYWMEKCELRQAAAASMK